MKAYMISEEVTHSNPKIIKDSDVTIFEAIIQEGDKPNRNKRVYKTSVLKEAMKHPYVQERLATKSWYGEAGHPINPDIQRQMYIDQTRISHIITSVNFDNNLLRGIVETANTNVGRDMQGLIRQGSKVAFSMRGFGPVSTTKGDIVEVEAPLTILAYDWEKC